jgi:hypothetical protein
MTQILLSPPPAVLARRPRSVAGPAVPTPEVEAVLRDLALVYRLTEQVKAALRTGR